MNSNLLQRVVVSAGMFALAATTMAAEQGPPDQPRERTDANSQAAHRDLLAKARQGVIDAYFIGDSITRRWGALDYPELLAHWNERFHGWNAANFAWGGDRTQNILWRLENGELTGVSPKVFVIQAGTNNLGDLADPAEQADAIVAGIGAIVAACRTHVPEAAIVLTALFPRRDHPEYNPVIDTVNDKLESFANRSGLRFIDINDSLRGDDGSITEAMAPDGLHPGLEAYDIWARALQAEFTEILGPRAATDHAPPPTGNPEAMPQSAAPEVPAADA